jgi:hypothetical protein
MSRLFQGWSNISQCWLFSFPANPSWAQYVQLVQIRRKFAWLLCRSPFESDQSTDRHISEETVVVIITNFKAISKLFRSSYKPRRHHGISSSTTTRQQLNGKVFVLFFIVSENDDRLSRNQYSDDCFADHLLVFVFTELFLY